MTATPHDPSRALREEIRGLEEVRSVLLARERVAEGRMGETEAELNACRKLRGFADIELDRKRAALAALTEEASGEKT